MVAIAGGTGSAKLLRGLAKAGALAAKRGIRSRSSRTWATTSGITGSTSVRTSTSRSTPWPRVADVSQGWGIAGDSFAVLSQLAELGEETWFKLGDRDLATHIFRTQRLALGKKLGEITGELCKRFKVRQRIIPSTDDPLETYIRTPLREMHLQEFWVKDHGEHEVSEVVYRGAENARPNRSALEALQGADRIVFCPANPATSILPILAVGGIREAIMKSRARKVAVSPMVGANPVSGPAAKMMRAMGYDATSLSVARLYSGLIDSIVIDESDSGQREAIEGGGVEVVTARILMRNEEEEAILAQRALAS